MLPSQTEPLQKAIVVSHCEVASSLKMLRNTDNFALIHGAHYQLVATAKKMLRSVSLALCSKEPSFQRFLSRNNIFDPLNAVSLKKNLLIRFYFIISLLSVEF